VVFLILLRSSVLVWCGAAVDMVQASSVFTLIDASQAGETISKRTYLL